MVTMAEDLFGGIQGKIITSTLLSVGTIIRKTDLQSVHGGKNENEPICYRCSY